MNDAPIRVPIDPDIADLIPGYLDSRREDVRSIRDALQADDLETARRIGHTIRGSGGSYGFTQLTDIGSALESAARDGDREEAARQLGELEAYLQRVEPVYD